MKPWSALFTAAIATLLCGCVGHGVISQYRVAPTKDVELAVVYTAKPGTAFSDVAEKSLEVTVSVAGRSSSGAPIYLFARRYSMQAADIDWTISWETSDRGRIDFVVYPSGKNKYDFPEPERSAVSKPLGFIVVTRQSADRFDVSSEHWEFPYTTRDFARKGGT